MRRTLPLAALLLAACQGAPLEPHVEHDGGATIGSGTLRASSSLIGSGNRSGGEGEAEHPTASGESGLLGSSGGRSEEEDGGGALGSGYHTGGAPPVAESEAAGQGNPMMGGGSG